MLAPGQRLGRRFRAARGKRRHPRLLQGRCRRGFNDTAAVSSLPRSEHKALGGAASIGGTDQLRCTDRRAAVAAAATHGVRLPRAQAQRPEEQRRQHRGPRAVLARPRPSGHSAGHALLPPRRCVCVCPPVLPGTSICLSSGTIARFTVPQTLFTSSSHTPPQPLSRCRKLVRNVARVFMLLDSCNL